MTAVYEQRLSRVGAVRVAWRAVAETDGRHPVRASEHWGLSFIRRVDGALDAELDGPRRAAHVVSSSAGETYWGVEFRSHVFLPGVDKRALSGETVRLPCSGAAVAFGDVTVAIPEFDALDAFVETLLSRGIVVADEEVRRALEGDAPGRSARTWQRHVRTTTGLTRSQVQQLRRARRAYRLLQGGMSCAEAAQCAGYADQAHLTRALRVFAGRTPGRILAGKPPPT
ncbi:Helix-turn-helix domain-containing protein [Prauserella aidingensis]|nr:Helix-turn-helix domain-containing protein [Prauserella aidingensis]